MNFTEWKKEIVNKCRAADACAGEFKKLLDADDEPSVWAVLLANTQWCLQNKIFKPNKTAGITLPKSVGCSLDLSGCDLKGITLPESVGGWLDLRGCDLDGVTIPDNLIHKVIK